MIIVINGAFFNKPGTIHFEHLVSLLPQALKQAKDLEFIIVSPRPVRVAELARMKNIVCRAPTLSWWYQFVLPAKVSALQPAYFYSLYDKRLPALRISRVCRLLINLPYSLPPARLNKRILLKASCIITASEYIRSRSWQKLNIPLERFYHLPHPLSRRYTHFDEKALKKEKNAFLKKNGLKEFILWCGEYNIESNLESLLKGFAELGPAHKEVKLVLWQKRNLFFYTRIQPQIKQLRLTDRIVLLKLPRSEDNIRQLLYNARLLVFPSRNDRLQYTLLKAMALGCPLVSHNSLSLPELVGRGGILINTQYTNQLTSAIASILENKKLVKTLAQNQTKLIKRFSARQIALDFLSLLKKN